LLFISFGRSFLLSSSTSFGLWALGFGQDYHITIGRGQPQWRIPDFVDTFAWEGELWKMDKVLDDFWDPIVSVRIYIWVLSLLRWREEELLGSFSRVVVLMNYDTEMIMTRQTNNDGF
jgi:hypothetical protein